MAASDIREYEAQAQSTDTFGRVMYSARNHHLIADGPAQNGCPGEEITPGEMFLASVACCGVELVQVIAKADGVPLTAISVKISGMMDRSRPPRSDFSLFNSVHLQFRLRGVDDPGAWQLVEKFKGR